MTELEKLEQIGAQEFYMEQVSQYTDEKGRKKWKYVPEHYIPTKGYGTIKESKWVEKAWAAVNEAGLMDLYKAIREHMKTHIYFLKTEEEKKKYALHIIVQKSYEHWPEFEYPSGEAQEIIWL